MSDPTRYNGSYAAVSLEHFYQNLQTELPIRQHQRATSAQESRTGTSLETQARSLRQAIESLKDGHKLLETAESELSAIADRLFSMKQLADDAASISATGSERQAWQNQFSEDKLAIDRRARSAHYKGNFLLNGGITMDIRTGTGAEDIHKVRLELRSARLHKLNSYDQADPNSFQLSAASLEDIEKFNVADTGDDPVYKTRAQIATDNAIDQVREQLSEVRALKERFSRIAEQQDLHLGIAEAALSVGDASDKAMVEDLLSGEKLQNQLNRELRQSRSPVTIRQHVGIESETVLPSLSRMHVRQNSAEGQAEQFLVDNADLMQIIDQNEELRTEYYLKTEPGREDESSLNDRRAVQEVLNSYVLKKLGDQDSVDSDFLNKNQALAKILAANPGDMLAKLTKDKELASQLADGALSSERTRNKIAEKAAALFSASGPLNEEFFKNNQDAAVFFLKHQDQAAEIARTSAKGLHKKRADNLVFSALEGFNAAGGDETISFTVYDRPGTQIASFSVALTAAANTTLADAVNNLNADASFNAYFVAAQDTANPSIPEDQRRLQIRLKNTSYQAGQSFTLESDVASLANSRVSIANAGTVFSPRTDQDLPVDDVDGIPLEVGMDEEAVASTFGSKAMQDRLAAYTASEALNVLGGYFTFTTGDYDQASDFGSTSHPPFTNLNRRKEVARFVVMEDLLAPGQLRTFAGKKRELLADGGSASIERFAEAFQAERAYAKTGRDFAISRKDLEDNPGLANMIANSNSALTLFQEHEDALRKILRPESGHGYSFEHKDELLKRLGPGAGSNLYRTKTLANRSLVGDIEGLLQQMNRHFYSRAKDPETSLSVSA